VTFALLGNGSAIKSTTLANTAVTQNGLTNYTLTFTTGASGGYVGDNLTIELQAAKQAYTSPPYAKGDPGGEVAIFDNVSLTAPEPSTYALMLTSLGFLVLLTRRNWLKS
jgi:hypothetical protein